MYRFGKTSLQRLETVHTALREGCLLAIKYSTVDFGITEGLRSEERAEKLMQEGKSKLGKKSKHCYGYAVDIVCYDENGKVTWELDYYAEVAKYFQKAAEELAVPMRWGGNWKVNDFELDAENKFVDAVHFELV